MIEGGVRMQDVAGAVGVSAATVSRALKGDLRISEGLRERIKEMAVSMGYVPNPMVQALMAQRRRREGALGEKLALVTNDVHDAWRGKDVCQWYMDGIKTRAEQLGCQVEAFSLEEYGHDPARLCKVLRARGIRGVILGFSRDGEHPGWIDVREFCVVGLGTYFSGLQVDRVHLNGFHNVKLAIRQLRALGYKKPALVAPVHNNAVVGGQWSAAALDEQWQMPEHLRCPPFMAEGKVVNMTAFRDWFEEHRPDAMIAYKVRVIELLERLRLKVPEDVGVAHLFGTEEERRTMAGIDGNLFHVGGATVDLLLQKMMANERGFAEHPRDVMIAGTWRDGPTLKAAMVESRPGKKARAADLAAG
ncbi:LacI family transcriptional regulator [Phragmitibacter flavus]|uniref:LacI family transcriptional regulator n=1 Tax=Phragmitibacter flavus TaxID=2576071 RepID=A0A5R8KC58_9BACT|nr:LacI family DNA-binding transcriptional regulator [Phragmitibacter flavus]TLD69817.1 LacI family transcriptional regulator [Phragmitibacter flavus]